MERWHVRAVCGAQDRGSPFRHASGADCRAAPCRQDHARPENGRSRANLYTLDDHTVLAAAQSDPVGFVRGLDRAIIDEVQRAPDLLLAIKKAVDEDYRPGRFLLTGAANVLSSAQQSMSVTRLASAMWGCWSRSFSFRHCNPGSRTRSNASPKRRSCISLIPACLARSEGWVSIE